MIQVDSGAVPAVTGFAGARCLAGAGSFSSALRDARVVGREPSIWRTIVGGRVLARSGVPGCSRCAPLVLGTVSQYWFSALSAGLSQPAGAAWATWLDAAHAYDETTRVIVQSRRTMTPETRADASR